MKIELITLFLAFGATSYAEDSWLCTETASKRSGDVFLTCGIHEGALESEARTGAYKAAQKEFEIACQSSADCRNRDYVSTPLRNSCKRVNNFYRCHRAIRFKILDKPKEHMTEYDSERIEEELEKTRQKYDEAKSLFEKQQELEELKQKIESKDFSETNDYFEQPYPRLLFGGMGFTQLSGLDGTGIDNDYLTFPFSAEFYDESRWGEEYTFIIGYSDQILAWSLQMLGRYYFTYRFSVGVGGAVNYVDFSDFKTGSIGFDEENASLTDFSAVLKASHRLGKNVSIEASYSVPLFSKTATFKGSEISRLNRLSVALNLVFPF